MAAEQVEYTNDYYSSTFESAARSKVPSLWMTGCWILTSIPWSRRFDLTGHTATWKPSSANINTTINGWLMGGAQAWGLSVFPLTLNHRSLCQRWRSAWQWADCSGPCECRSFGWRQHSWRASLWALLRWAFSHSGQLRKNSKQTNKIHFF